MPANEETTAVKVTGFPSTEGFTEESSVVVVVALTTTCDTVLDVLPVKLLSPLLTAVMECVPIARPLVVRLATLPLTAVLPSVIAPSLKVSVPDA